MSHQVVSYVYELNKYWLVFQSNNLWELGRVVHLVLQESYWSMDFFPIFVMGFSMSNQGNLILNLMF